jgi:hypothetical protein
LQPCNLTIPWLGNTRYNLFHSNFWAAHIDDAPLTRRGWACQERLLAPRVLHLGRHQLLWECRSLAAAEQYPHGLPLALRVQNALFKALDPRTDGRALRRLTQEPDQGEEFHACQLWNKVVGAYSGARLTRAEDKVIALSGIAKHMRAAVNGGDAYVAGLWRRHLASQLVWMVPFQSQGDGAPAVRPGEYRAPSFSWMAIDAMVMPANCTDFEVLAEVKSVEITHATDDDTGLVTGGHLVLEGTLKRLAFKRNAFVGRIWEMSVNGESLFKRMGKKKNHPVVHFDVHQDEFPNELFGVNIVGPNWSPTKRLLRGLILEALPSTPVRFKRLGMYSALDDLSIQMLLDHHVNEPFLPCSKYDAQTRRHTFVII